ncbi:hypothetical protein D3C81_1960230 [compost metagenome]
MNKGRGIEGKGIKWRRDLPFFDPFPGQGIAIGAFQRVHSMLKHIELIERFRVRGGKVDVPFSVDVMQLRCPNKLAHRAALWLTPDHHFGCVA